MNASLENEDAEKYERFKELVRKYMEEENSAYRPPARWPLVAMSLVILLASLLYYQLSPISAQKCLVLNSLVREASTSSDQADKIWDLIKDRTGTSNPLEISNWRYDDAVTVVTGEIERRRQQRVSTARNINIPY